MPADFGQLMSASWINQVERWFIELTRKQIRRLLRIGSWKRRSSSGTSISLQPISVEGQTGLSIAGGVIIVTLAPARWLEVLGVSHDAVDALEDHLPVRE